MNVFEPVNIKVNGHTAIFDEQMQCKSSAAVCHMIKICINPIALRTAKISWSFGCSECNRVKKKKYISILLPFISFSSQYMLCVGQLKK